LVICPRPLRFLLVRLGLPVAVNRRIGRTFVRRLGDFATNAVGLGVSVGQHLSRFRLHLIDLFFRDPNHVADVLRRLDSALVQL